MVLYLVHIQKESVYMTMRFLHPVYILVASFSLVSVCRTLADDDGSAKPKKEPKVSVTAGASPSATPTVKPTTTSVKPTAPDHAKLLKDAKPIAGLIPLYQKESKLYAELSSSHYTSEYLVLISIARGIGQGMLLGGMTWGFGDDWVWKFRKVDKKIHVIRRNVRFKAKKDTPEASAVKNAYTDSVLFSLPIAAKGPKGGDLVELSPVFMSDLPQISHSLPGFMFSASKSTWGSLKGFKDNMEMEVAATYTSSGRISFDTVPDSRGVTLTVHYSVSKIPTTGYKTRKADDRVGYFLTVAKDFSKKDSQDRFVRYINRWRLEKADSSAKLSPPKEPIIFWIEQTVPFKYRKPIRDGILEWNKAYEKAGFVNAIEVRQQPDDAEWEPEDINYNTFRWITANAGFAMGPSRVNPYTGQILDADIIFDADFLTYWKQEFETLTTQSIATMTGGDIDIRPADTDHPHAQDTIGSQTPHCACLPCLLNRGMARQLAFGATAIIARAEPKEAAELEEKMIMQGLKEVAMHEVGHTLGLRHNFKGSTYLNLKDINDPPKAGQSGTVASVMDYAPANIVPKSMKQGDFFTSTIGPYDYWAIEYGYKQFSSSEDDELKKIAARSGERALKYATDEDTRGTDPDPEANRFDLGDDTLAYAKQRAELMNELIPGLVDRVVKDGDDYTKARKSFNVILSQYGEAMFFAARYVGGLYTSRSHKGDKDGRLPITAVDPKKQRDALTVLEQQVFSDKPFHFPPELYNHLSSSSWNHWGQGESLRKDFPAHSVILMWQERILAQLLSSVTLERIHDTELKVPADKDAFTAAELLERLTGAVFAELDAIKGGNFTNRKPAITSLRRNLQRSYQRELAYLAMGRTFAPEDCQTIAYAELASLKGRIDGLLAKNVKLDSYSRAHLQESASRIEKVLDARLSLFGP